MVLGQRTVVKKAHAGACCSADRQKRLAGPINRQAHSARADPLRTFNSDGAAAGRLGVGGRCRKDEPAAEPARIAVEKAARLKGCEDSPLWLAQVRAGGRLWVPERSDLP